MTIEQATSITCPDCGRTSRHPEDVREGYCGHCHWWTSHPDLKHLRPALREAPELYGVAHEVTEQVMGVSNPPPIERIRWNLGR